ncbi:putative F-box domain, FBD domain, leucine-rich repeat domain, L domain-containing protein [Medicago truncatula]|uniref:F-box/RNI/FBD-like domain protein n=1 Tax=Medicago truncatula TaxID=3880 RepID=A0A072U7S7_MEDTR|nr:F-box/RNI/FBD-like domain protein [Medicago truncatula]RHN50536.1 putative F-box domain, FBD domain, leucine-rich repeat domain, L domain-containing protein [Medicago truncatula]
MKKRRKLRESKEKWFHYSASSSTVQVNCYSQEALYNCENDLVDRISDLPDELLLYILSFLQTKLAFTTSILSKRWTALCYSLPVVESFRSFVNNVILSPLSTNKPIKKISLKYDFRYHPENSRFNVTNWLQEAKKPHIEEIHLTLPFHTLKHVIFVSQTLVVLKLQSLYVGKDTSSVHLPSLKTLNLTSVSFENRDDYINFLNACPILEDLHAELIYFMRHDENNAAEEGLKPLTLPMLVRVSIGIMDGLFNGINNVKFLRIVMECTGAFSLKAIPLFPNLISIELLFPSYSYICWYGVVKLLRHCPKLQILFIKKWRYRFTSLYGELDCPYPVLDCDTSNLRSCTILNFDGSDNDLRFAKYILKNGSLLQEMRIGVTTEGMVLGIDEIIEEFSSYSRITQGCKFIFV